MVGGDEPRVAWGRTRLHVAEFARTHMLKPGQKAPKFKAKTQNDEYVSLEEILANGNGLVLFFYPKDSTPGCTKEACDFRDAFADFEQSGYKILGVSKDSAVSHVRFMENNSLQYDLIVDTDLVVQNAYGVWQEKTNYGKTYMGTVRSTFVIEKDGVLSVANYNVRATGHVERLSKELGIATSKAE
jgi:peroxiredoxin Q/BCP